MKALRIFCLGGLLLLYAQVGLGQDSIRTEHLQEVKVNARQHRILTSTSPLQLLDNGDMLRLGVTDILTLCTACQASICATMVELEE